MLGVTIHFHIIWDLCGTCFKSEPMCEFHKRKRNPSQIGMRFRCLLSSLQFPRMTSEWIQNEDTSDHECDRVLVPILDAILNYI